MALPTLILYFIIALDSSSGITSLPPTISLDFGDTTLCKFAMWSPTSDGKKTRPFSLRQAPPRMGQKNPPRMDRKCNTKWFTYPGIWAIYILILFFLWPVVLSVFGCPLGIPTLPFSLLYFIVTYQCFHWKKGTLFADDQGIYNRLTWWEQIENGKQLTPNRKLLTVAPVVLYSLTHYWLSTPYALLQHTSSFHSGCCQVSTYAQSSYIWNHCRPMSSHPLNKPITVKTMVWWAIHIILVDFSDEVPIKSWEKSSLEHVDEPSCLGKYVGPTISVFNI
ncbi:uncharacterized protein LOC111371172 [Olea europaea var. sylvestris]|uniref:uncharacterized protein LOC111371172 n=1 Tax=Olea europaea var. sylvestris TaxID=158386 RepID=UPI000C1CDEC7|nr:uncharacterized protein LOC111371172 [Olea europaea var. sylvestris]